MEYKILQDFLSSIINTIQNTAIASVKGLKKNLFNVKVKNFPKTQEIKGTVVVGNQRNVEKEIKELKKKVSDIGKDLYNGVKSIKIPEAFKVTNLKDIPRPDKIVIPPYPKEISVKNQLKDIKVNNLKEVKDPILKSLEEINKAVNRLEMSPNINVDTPVIPAPVVNVEAPIVKVEKEEYNFDKVVKSLIGKVFHRNPKNYIPVRLTDGDKFYEAMKEMMAISSGGGGGGSRMLRIDGKRTAPLIDETNSQFVTVMPLSIIEDKTNPDMVYVGYAPVGSTESSSKWRISRISKDDDIEKVEWAGGEILFNKKWTQRSTYDYTT